MFNNTTKKIAKEILPKNRYRAHGYKMTIVGELLKLGMREEAEKVRSIEVNWSDDLGEIILNT